MKIKKIRLLKLDKPELVYDLTVDRTENFVLKAGVVVHNSKDISDAVCAACYVACSVRGTKKGITSTTASR